MAGLIVSWCRHFDVPLAGRPGFWFALIRSGHSIILGWSALGNNATLEQFMAVGIGLDANLGVEFQSCLGQGYQFDPPVGG